MYTSSGVNYNSNEFIMCTHNKHIIHLPLIEEGKVWVWSLSPPPCNEPHPEVTEPLGVLLRKVSMAARNFEDILEEKPTLDELCEHICIGSK